MTARQPGRRPMPTVTKSGPSVVHLLPTPQAGPVAPWIHPLVVFRAVRWCLGHALPAGPAHDLPPRSWPSPIYKPPIVERAWVSGSVSACYAPAGKTENGAPALSPLLQRRRPHR